MAFGVGLVPQTRLYFVPAALMGACLVLALIFQIRGWQRAWAGLTAASLAVLIVSGLTLIAPALDAMTSARAAALALKNLDQDGEPIVSTKFLARGIYFYVRQPVAVLAENGQPFWTPHPLPLVAGRRGLESLLVNEGTALLAVRTGDWKEVEKSPSLAAREAFQKIGDKVVVRACAALTK